ncbi:MAG: pyridoxal phosphate-dependent aminotransferase [Pseudomonadota bacterium]
MSAKLTDIAAELPASVPFVGPETQERARGAPFRARIGANENVFGPSPAAIEAMRRTAADQWMYGDPDLHDLRQAIAAHHGLPPESIVIGEGIDGLFGYTNRLFVQPGDKVVTSAGAYPTFNYHVSGYGGELITVMFRDDHEDLEGLSKAAAYHRPKLVYLSNPDNPMGSWHSAEDVQSLIDAMPDGTLLCLDEAYIEFAPEGTAPTWDPEDRRVIRFRTFSKAYGLAGLRIAYAVSHPETALAFNRIRNHFGVSRMAQEAALASLADPDHLDRVRALVAHARNKISQIARNNGLIPLPSATNFVTVDCGADHVFAKAVTEALLDRDVFVRMPGVPPLARCIRISAGTDADLDILSDVLPGAIGAARSAVTAPQHG